MASDRGLRATPPGSLRAALQNGESPVWWLRDWLRRYDEGASVEDPVEGIRDVLVEVDRSARDLAILAENVAMVRKAGLDYIERGDDPVEVFERMLDHIAGFVAGTQAMVVPPHMIDPAGLKEAVALGRKLAEQYGLVEGCTRDRVSRG